MFFIILFIPVYLSNQLFCYPDRLKASFPRLDFKLCTELTFEQPDTTRFRNLALAYEALHRDFGAHVPVGVFQCLRFGDGC